MARLLCTPRRTSPHACTQAPAPTVCAHAPGESSPVCTRVFCWACGAPRHPSSHPTPAPEPGKLRRLGGGGRVGKRRQEQCREGAGRGFSRWSFCVSVSVSAAGPWGRGWHRRCASSWWFRVSRGHRQESWVPGTLDLHQSGLAALRSLQACHSQIVPFQQIKPCRWIASAPSSVPSLEFGAPGP